MVWRSLAVAPSGFTLHIEPNLWVRIAFRAYALVSSLSRATRSCSSLSTDLAFPFGCATRPGHRGRDDWRQRNRWSLVQGLDRVADQASRRGR